MKTKTKARRYLVRYTNEQQGDVREAYVRATSPESAARKIASRPWNLDVHVVDPMTGLRFDADFRR